MRFSPFHWEPPEARTLMRNRSTRLIQNVLLSAAIILACDASGSQRVYDTPEAAVEALINALAADNLDELGRIFGPEFKESLEDSDREDAKRDRAIISDHAKREGTRLNKVSESEQNLLIGEVEWPFPVPLVRDESGWRFDTTEGLEEIANRRVGENENNAINVARVYSEAQEEYALEDRDGDQVREFAQRLISTKGKRDGLFWPVDEGASEEESSPFGPMIAEAQEVQPGYERGDPFQGYFFKILTSQGPNPPGGEYDYIINDNMIAGYALVAFPAEHGKTGVMTFVVSHQGIVYEKDLGPFPGMDRYDPDSSWTAVED
jgi:hypothetical protein